MRVLHDLIAEARDAGTVAPVMSFLQANMRAAERLGPEPPARLPSRLRPLLPHIRLRARARNIVRQGRDPGPRAGGGPRRGRDCLCGHRHARPGRARRTGAALPDAARRRLPGLSGAADDLPDGGLAKVPRSARAPSPPAPPPRTSRCPNIIRSCGAAIRSPWPERCGAPAFRPGPTNSTRRCAPRWRGPTPKRPGWPARTSSPRCRATRAAIPSSCRAICRLYEDAFALGAAAAMRGIGQRPGYPRCANWWWCRACRGRRRAGNGRGSFIRQTNTGSPRRDWFTAAHLIVGNLVEAVGEVDRRARIRNDPVGDSVLEPLADLADRGAHAGADAQRRRPRRRRAAALRRAATARRRAMIENGLLHGSTPGNPALLCIVRGAIGN